MYQERGSKWAKILYNKYLNVADPTPFLRIRNPPKGSNSWYFMLNFHLIISKYVTWDIGKGEEALFWEDSWDDLPPLDSLNVLVNIKNTLVNLW